MFWLTNLFASMLAATLALAASPTQLLDQDAAAADATVTATASQQASQHGDADPAVIALLDALERSHAELRGFVADVRYDRYLATFSITETRLGEVIYIADLEQSSAEDQSSRTRRFAILFDTFVKGRRKREQLQHFVFDGRWLAEINHEDKQFIKREVVAPGKTLDPLKLGEGPFPMPIGQTRESVLSRFVVTTAQLPKTGVLADLSVDNVDGLMLTPRPGTPEASDFTSVTIFYDRETRLPVGVIASEPNGDSRTVHLTNVTRDPELTSEIRRKVSIETPPADQWRLDIRPWNG